MYLILMSIMTIYQINCSSKLNVSFMEFVQMANSHYIDYVNYHYLYLQPDMNMTSYHN